MRKLIVHCTNSKYRGTDGYLPLLVEDGSSEESIHEQCWERAVEHASSYFEVVDPSDMDEYDGECLSTEDIDYYYMDYDAQKHDGYRSGGGSFEKDFQMLETYK